MKRTWTYLSFLLVMITIAGVMLSSFMQQQETKSSMSSPIVTYNPWTVDAYRWMLMPDYNTTLYQIRNLMNVNVRVDNPVMRLWSRIPEHELHKCSGCLQTENLIVENEIWVVDDITEDEGLLLTIMYFQLHDRHVPYDVIFSTTLAGERNYILERWKITKQLVSPPIILTDDTPDVNSDNDWDQ